MTRNDIIRMAKEANSALLEHFARLIENHLSYDGIHTCNDQCQRPACVAVRKAVEREREACAQIAEFNQSNHLEHLTAEQIRARGQQ